MAPERPKQTAADYVTIVLSPALIMGLVGSLVFFLLEVLYTSDGEWKQRLQWILFFFVFGAVLNARISMNGAIAGRARLYGSILALAAYLGMQAFVEYPEGLREVSFAANLVLVAVVWWCAHRLTWDCTNVDEETDMSGEGLLQAAGLEGRPTAESPTRERGEGSPTRQRGSQDEVIEAVEEELGWLERWRRYREQRQKKRTLGVWVVYFSLAALPIFGLGQAFLPLLAQESRRFAFWLMTVYVACGLGLLLTTCFLGLRRYLRQKRLQMPAAMTGMWLISGGSLLVFLLVLGALLPRPHSEYPLTEVLNPAGSAKRQASNLAVKGDSPGEGKGQPGAAQPDGKAPADKGEGQGRGKDGKGKGEGDDKDKQGGGKDHDKDGKSDDNKGQRGRPQEGNKSQAGNQDKTAKAMQDMHKAASSSTPPKLNSLRQLLQRVAPVLKWVVFAVLAVVVIGALLRGGLGFLANFTDWARRLLDWWRNLLDGLFGGREEVSGAEGEDEEEETLQPAMPFSAFANPFDSGKAERMSPRDLVRYSFAALEAWAREHSLERGGHETAMEFVDRLGEEVPALEAEAKRLGGLHARVEYSRGGLPGNAVDQVRGFWEKLDRVATAPLSA